VRMRVVPDHSHAHVLLSPHESGPGPLSCARAALPSTAKRIVASNGASRAHFVRPTRPFGGCNRAGASDGTTQVARGELAGPPLPVRLGLRLEVLLAAILAVTRAAQSGAARRSARHAEAATAVWETYAAGGGARRRDGLREGVEAVELGGAVGVNLQARCEEGKLRRPHARAHAGQPHGRAASRARPPPRQRSRGAATHARRHTPPPRCVCGAAPLP